MLVRGVDVQVVLIVAARHWQMKCSSLNARVCSALLRVPLLISTSVGLIWLFAPGAHAQTVRGHVEDGRSGDRVAMAYVALVAAENRQSVFGTTTGEDGSFVLEAPSGLYFIYASALGYHSAVDGPFELESDGASGVEVRLHPEPVMMDSIRATVTRTERYLRGVGFYERRERGWGRFIDTDEIRRKAVGRVAEAFRGIARVHVLDVSPSDAGRIYPEIRIRHGKDLCAPNIYVDEQLVHAGPEAIALDPRHAPERDPAMPDEFVTPADVAAIEVYRSSSEVPPRYNTSRGCGVILIWTWH